MKIFKIFLVLFTLFTFGVGVIFAQSQKPQLNNLVKAGIQEQKTNAETALVDKEVTTGEIQSAGEGERSGSVGSGSKESRSGSGSKDFKEVKIPEVNVEKEIETESKSSSTDHTSQGNIKSSSDK